MLHKFTAKTETGKRLTLQLYPWGCLDVSIGADEDDVDREALITSSIFQLVGEMLDNDMESKAGATAENELIRLEAELAAAHAMVQSYRRNRHEQIIQDRELVVQAVRHAQGRQ